MVRRLPPALVVLVALLAPFARAEEEPVRASVMSVTLEGGVVLRNTQQAVVENNLTGQTRPTQIVGVSPWLVRLKADWYPLRWFGVEAEGLGDFFRGQNADVKVSASSRGAMRASAALRYLSAGGFLLSGSLGYGAWWAPYISTRSSTPTAGTLGSHGLVGRLSVGYTGARFEAVAGAQLWLPVGGYVLGLEPQLWLGGRVIDLGPFALWAGVDAGVLFEGSNVGYGGFNGRASLAVRLTLLPPASPSRLVDGKTAGETALSVQLTLPGGAPAVGAMVSVDDAAPVAADAQGVVKAPVKAGTHAVKAALAGHRPATTSAQALEGAVTTVPLRLEALTGPGSLAGVVRATATGKPVADVTVTAGDLPSQQTGADGSYRFEKLGPGPVQVRFDAQGFTSSEEVAQVPPEAAATLDVQLEALGKGSPATVRGLVRSRTGEALTGSVVIKGSSLKVQVSPEGRFFVTVPGGTYLFIISAPGYVTQSKKVVLADGDQAILHTELQKVSK